MKAKLLKKVRKRFSISRIDDIGSHPIDKYKTAKKEYGCPFYLIEDKEDFRQCLNIRKTEEEAKKLLLEIILKTYSKDFKYRKTKSTKIWYK